MSLIIRSLAQVAAGLGTAAAPSISFATDTATGLFRAASGVLGIAGNVGVTGTGANGALLGIKTLTENVIIAAAATSTSVIQLPAGAILLACSARVTVIGVTSWPATFGLAIGATQAIATGTSTALNTTASGAVTPILFAAATSAVITPVGTPGDAIGRIRINICYLDSTPPTS